MRRLRVQVVFAWPDRQILRQVDLPEGATAIDAVEASKLWTEFPELNSASEQFGRFGRLIGRLEPLRDGDRVEILRPLLVDPKEARRLSAAKSGRRSFTRPPGR
jgi:putative ubiquitin-RnfH superfamily antitoxin RatB of RatAB toxin-antitoxin module